MNSNIKSVKIALAAAVLATGLPFTVSAGQIADWHGRTEKSLVEALGAPASRVGNTGGTQTLTYIHEHQGRRISAGPKSGTAVQVPSQRHLAKFEVGSEGRITAAYYADGQNCDMKL